MKDSEIYVLGAIFIGGMYVFTKIGNKQRPVYSRKFTYSYSQQSVESVENEEDMEDNIPEDDLPFQADISVNMDTYNNPNGVNEYSAFQEQTVNV
jgi:hypothetical protein